MSVSRDPLLLEHGDKILVVGSGNGYELVWFHKAGYPVKGLELYTPNVPLVKKLTTIGSATDMPWENKEFDLVFCTEMFEHVTEEETELILKEMKRVAKRFYITIATRGDAPYNTHINIQKPWWWMAKFDELGFKIESFQYSPRVFLQFGKDMGFGVYNDGVTIYGDC